mmetsp:Transcript_96808/g.270231  ORF Transcript_96808/g.270231 Transcript_96808/m.270231 type:complete len:520 (+) Transcript_96808:66-1625(+)
MDMETAGAVGRRTWALRASRGDSSRAPVGADDPLLWRRSRGAPGGAGQNVRGGGQRNTAAMSRGPATRAARPRVRRGSALLLGEDLVVRGLLPLHVLPEGLVLHHHRGGLLGLGHQLGDLGVEGLDHELQEPELALGHRGQARLAVAEGRHGEPPPDLLVALGPELGQHPPRPAEHDVAGPARAGEVRGVQQGLQEEELLLHELLLLALVGHRQPLLLVHADLAELFHVLRVPRHVRRQHHRHQAAPHVLLDVDAGGVALLEVLLEQLEPVAAVAGLQHGLEREGYVVILQDALVVVADGQFGHGRHVEQRVCTWMADVVDRCGQQAHEVVQRRRAISHEGHLHEPLHRRGHVHRVRAGVISGLLPVKAADGLQELEEPGAKGVAVLEPAVLLEIFEHAALLLQQLSPEDLQRLVAHRRERCEGDRVEVEGPSLIQKHADVFHLEQRGRPLALPGSCGRPGRVGSAVLGVRAGDVAEGADLGQRPAAGVDLGGTLPARLEVAVGLRAGVVRGVVLEQEG